MQNLGKLSLLLACATLLLAGCDRFRSADTFVARGQQKFRDGNFIAASGDFKSALERDPANLQARVELARVSYHVADFEGAQAAIDQAFKAGANSADALLLKYRILLARRQLDAVIAGVPAETTLSPVQRAVLLGQAYAGAGKYQEAAAAYEQALQAAPDDTEALTAQAQLFADSGDATRALANVDKVLAANPNDAMGLFVKGAVKLATGDFPAALAALQSASKQNKQLDWYRQTQLYAMLAETTLLTNDAAAAGGWIDNLERRVPQSVLGHYLRARLALLNKNPNDALGHLQKAAQHADHLPSRLMLASVLLSQRKYGQAEEVLDRLLSGHRDNVEARKLLAQLYLLTNRAADVAKVLPADRVDDAGVDWLRGQSLLAAGSREAGIELLEKSVAADRGNHAKALQLARAYLFAGASDKARQLLEQLPATAGKERQQLLLLARVIGKNGVDARSEVDNLIKQNPRDAALHTAAGGVLGQLGDAGRAMDLLRQAVALDGNNEARILLAALQFRARQFTQAEEQLNAVLAADAKNVSAYLGLARSALENKDRPRAVKQLELAVGADPAAVEPRLQLAQLALLDEDYGRANAMLDQAVAASDRSVPVLRAAGGILLAAKRYEDALLRFNQAVAAGDAASKLNAAQVQEALGQSAQARQKLETLSTDPALQVAATVLLARMDVKDQKPEAALKRVAALGQRGVKQAVVDELNGDIYLATQQLERAATGYDSAYAAAPSAGLAFKRYQVRMARKQSNAPEALSQWLQKTPRDLAIRKILARHWATQGAAEQAVREYEQWLDLSPIRDPEIMNDLAWLYGEKSDVRALPLAREAYLASGRAEIADTYGWLLLGQKSTAEALAILEKAAKEAPAVGEIQYHYALALARSGKQAAAQSSLQQLLAGNAQFASRAAAEQLLRSLSQ
jgi:cellulose synthase operon protein C